MSSDLFYDNKNGTFATYFDDTLTFVASGSTGLNPEKLVYCGLMMNREQLQTIIDNAYLFGQPMANAAHLVAMQFDTLKVLQE